MNDLDELIGRLERLGSVQPTPEATDRALHKVRACLDEPRTAPRWIVAGVWRRSAVAAAVLFATVGGLCLWLSRGPSSAQASLADIQDKMRAAHSVSFREVKRAKGMPDQITRMFIRSDGLLRSDQADGSYTVTSTPAFTALIVDARRHQATLWRGVNLPSVNLYELIRDLPGDGSARPAPERVVEGKKAPGLTVTMHGEMMNVWVDARTRLPVLMEAQERGDGGQQAEVILDQFVFDKPIDSALFSLDAPAGYKLETKGVAVLPPAPSTAQTIELVATPLVGLGPVRFGMKREEVEKLLGKPDAVQELGKKRGYHLNYGSRGFFIVGANTIGVLSISCVSQAIMAIRVRDFAGKTDKGIRLGASEADIIRAYGKPDSRRAERGTTSLEYYSLRTDFTVCGEKLVQILLMRPQPAR